MDKSAVDSNTKYDSKLSEEVKTPLLICNGSDEHKSKANDVKAGHGYNDIIFETVTASTHSICVPGSENGTDKFPNRTRYCLEDPPDGGWGWVITFCAFMVGVILDGIAFSFGLFFIDLCEYFNESKSLTAWISSVLNGTYMSIGPLTSVLVSVFGCRKVVSFGAILTSVAFFVCTWSPNVLVMIFVYGLIAVTSIPDVRHTMMTLLWRLMASLGSVTMAYVTSITASAYQTRSGLGMMYLPTLVTVGHYFKKRRALATGIAVCGSGVGGFIFAPLSQFLIDMYTWKGAMWVISAISLNGVVIATLLRPVESVQNTRGVNNNLEENGQNLRLMKDAEYVDSECARVDTEVSKQKQCCDVSELFDFSLLKSLTFLVYGCSCFLCMLGFFIPFTYIPDLAEDYGMTPQQGALLISIIGILNTVSRVLVGWTADRSWADALVLNNVALVIGGLATMFVPYYTKFGIMATYSVVFGSTIAVFVSLRSVIMAELLGIQKLNTSLGLVTLCQGLSTFIGTPIAGALSDVTGNYVGAFYLAGATICLSGIICLPLRRISKWENRRNEITVTSQMQ